MKRSWFTTFNKRFLEPKYAKEGMIMLEKVADLEIIPPHATWSASVRGFGIVVFAEWQTRITS